MADPSTTEPINDTPVDDLFAGMKKKKKSKKVNFDEELDASASTPVVAAEEEIAAPVAETTPKAKEPTVKETAAPATADPVTASVLASAADEGALDFSDLKKKKKKKVVRIADSDDETYDGAGDDKSKVSAKKFDKLGNEIEDEVQEPEATSAEGASEHTPASGTGDEFADLKKKKKKGKKSTFDLEAFEAELAAAEASEGVTSSPATTPAPISKGATPAGSDGEDAGDDLEDDGALEGEDPFGGDEETTKSKAELAAEAKAWLKEGDRDYTYTELLGRFYTALYTSHPSLSAHGSKKVYKLAPPSMHREGNKRSIFANVVDICKRMHRQPEHVIQFLFAELGTSGSVDGSGRLVIKGRFQQKQMEVVLRRYIVQYVQCASCKSPDTLLTKKDRLFFMTCEQCGSTRSIAAIKTGFQAQTGKRKKLAV